MLIVGLVVYFSLACAALALMFLPDARGWARQRAQRVWTGSSSAARSIALVGEARFARTGQLVAAASGEGGRWVARHRRWIALAVVVVVLLPLLAVVLRLWQPISTFDHTVAREVNEQVAALLEGEQLVPPPPLAPELFTTRDVEQARPLIRYADRRWELLDADFRKRLLAVYKIMEEKHGYRMVLLEGYRTPARQAQLADLGPHVTRAGAYESYHQYGLAADNAFLRDGRIVISERDPWAMRGYELYGEVARSAGLVWGGEWTLKDFGHVELRRPGALKSRGGEASPSTAQEQ